MKNLSLLFSGRGSNVSSILSHIIKKRLNFNVKIIVCDNKNAAGIKMLENYNFNYTVLDTRSFANKIDFNIELKNILSPKKNDILLLCGYMNKIPEHLINAYNGNIINIHPSLLPKYKGLNTHEKVIQNNDTEHGCSVHFVTSNIDDGPIIAQYHLPIKPSDDKISIAEKLLPLEHKLYYEVLKIIENDRIVLLNNEVILDGVVLKKPIKYI
tara:strand:- start:26 stop:661 length:636 start_codon:yes stop_codon:yes gene_type:complete